MPTAGRLAGALVFATFAWYLSDIIIPLLPEGTQVGRFAQGNAVIGWFCGWLIMGSRASQGFWGAIGGGLTTAAALVIWGLFIHSMMEMVARSIRKRYDGVMDAIIGMLEIALGFTKIIAVPHVVITLVVGGIICGAITGWVARRWS